MSDFNEKLPEWQSPGTEPPNSLKNEGWVPGQKPPADYFNWIFNRAYKVLDEIRSVITNKFSKSGHKHTGTDGDGAQISYNDLKDKPTVVAPSWDNITGKPNSFPPSVHNHTLDDVAETSTKKIMTNSERTKLANIQAEANKYEHPATHPPSIIQQDVNNRFVTDAQIISFNAKETTTGAQAKADAAYNAAVNHANAVANQARNDANGYTDIIHDQLFGYVSDGKNRVASAVTDMGVPTLGSDTFATMEANIRSIYTGLKYAKMTVPENQSSGLNQRTFNRNIFLSGGLSFVPRFVVVSYKGTISVSGGGGTNEFVVCLTDDTSKYPTTTITNTYVNSYRLTVTPSFTFDYGGKDLRIHFDAPWVIATNGNFEILLLGE